MNTSSDNIEIVTGTILPIEYLRDNIPVTQYFKHNHTTNDLVASFDGDGTDLGSLQASYDYFEVGRVDSSVQRSIEAELIEPAKKNLEVLVSDCEKKLADSKYLNDVYYNDSLKEDFLSRLEKLYNDHLTLLNLKKISDFDKELLEQSLDICSLATILAIRSNLSTRQVDTICKASLLINIGRTQLSSRTDIDPVDDGCKYLEILGYNGTIINVVRFKASFEITTPEPRLLIGMVKASYLYHMSVDQFRSDDFTTAQDRHEAIIKKLKAYVSLRYLSPRVYYLVARVFNEAQSK